MLSSNDDGLINSVWMADTEGRTVVLRMFLKRSRRDLFLQTGRRKAILRNKSRFLLTGQYVSYSTYGISSFTKATPLFFFLSNCTQSGGRLLYALRRCVSPKNFDGSRTFVVNQDGNSGVSSAIGNGKRIAAVERRG